jgi:hypothetical protein
MVTLTAVLPTVFLRELEPSAMNDTTGASNENRLSLVPTVAATDSVACTAGPEPAAPEHWTVVADDHAVVLQAASFIVAVGVAVWYPKLRPEIVTVEPPDVAAFDTATGAWDNTGESNDHCPMRVPTTAETVSAAIFGMWPVGALLIFATIVVALLHDAELIMSSVRYIAIYAVGVRSTSTKFIPVRVTAVPPVLATFAVASNDSEGASQVNPLTLVPTTACTVTTDDCTAPAPGLTPVAQLREVSDVQTEVAQ